MAGDERPEVATNATEIRIPNHTPDPKDPSLSDAVIVSIGEQGTVVDLLRAADDLAYSSTLVLSAVVNKLERRRKDVEELLSIAKSGSELSRKVERLAARLRAEGVTDVQ